MVVEKIWMWLCVETRSYLGSGDRVGHEEDRKKYCETEKYAKRVVYMAMDEKAREAVEKVDSCRDGCGLFRTAKQRLGEKSVVVVICLKDESSWGAGV